MNCTNTRKTVHKNAWFLPRKRLEVIKAELSQAILEYKKYDNVYFWEAKSRGIPSPTEYRKTIYIGFFLRIYINIFYQEIGGRCKAERSVYINNRKSTIRVAKTALDEIKEIIQARYRQPFPFYRW